MSTVEPPEVRYGHAREALLQATVDLSARVGFHGVTVAGLSVAANVGPRTFYNHFADLDDAFFEACEQMHRQLRQAIRDAYEVEVVSQAENGVELDVSDENPSGRRPSVAGRYTSRARARARARRCVEALFAFIEADPVRARVLFVQSHAGGPAITALRRETVEWLITLVQDPPAEDDAAADAEVDIDGGTDADVVTLGSRGLLAEVAVGGIHEVLSRRIGAGEIDDLGEWVPWAVDTLMWPATKGR